MQEKQSDIHLLQQISEGDQNAFRLLFDRYFSKLLQYGKKWTEDESLIEECIQELFVYLFTNKKTLLGVQEPTAYLYTAFRRRVLNAIKKESRRANLNFSTEKEKTLQFSQEDFLIQEEEQLERSEKVERLLNELPTRQREAVYLRYYDELSTAEIARVMGISKQGVLNMLYKAIKKLRQTSHLTLTIPLVFFILFLPLP
ncbi:MAG: RNA polymerase sigma factor [Bacteroidota bacterium]